jgi:transposase
MCTKKIRVVQLFKRGLNQRQIAIKEGLTEKTVGLWLKPIKASKKENTKNIQILESKLKILLENKTASPREIKDLTTAIKQLESRF